MSFTRRAFMKGGAIAVFGTAAVPSFLTRAAFGQSGFGGKKRLVVIFQRGAADGLNIVVPHGEPIYYQMRPTIAIPRPSAFGGMSSAAAIDLDGYFGLHPAMEALHPLWQQKHLAIVHAAGSPDETRSHFDAQDYMESGTPGIKSTEDGWLNRALTTEERGERIGSRARDVAAAAANAAASPFRAVALGTQLPRTLSGPAPAVAISNINDFGVGGRQSNNPAASAFESMYAGSTDTILHGSGDETFEAVKMLKAANPSQYTPAAGANYPRGRFGDSLKQVAQLLKADLGVEVAFVDIGGWDHHVNEGNTQGQLANLLREFSQSIAAFWTDLGNLGEDTVVVTMSEFGRTVRENGTRGTDHGHANVMFVMGGPVRGGRVYGRWPGLDERHLYEARDLDVTTDFRSVLAEAVAHQLGVRDVNPVFPGFSGGQRLGFLG